MCAARRDPILVAVVGGLKEAGVQFALAHESSLMGWGIDNNAFLGVVDAVLLDDGSFAAIGAEPPGSLGGCVSAEIAGVPTRLWSRASIGALGPVDVTLCPDYGCYSLAPEVVLSKLPYSPDYGALLENRARLAAIVHVDSLDDDELSLVARHVRGD